MVVSRYSMSKEDDLESLIDDLDGYDDMAGLCLDNEEDDVIRKQVANDEIYKLLKQYAMNNVRDPSLLDLDNVCCDYDTWDEIKYTPAPLPRAIEIPVPQPRRKKPIIDIDIDFATSKFADRAPPQVTIEGNRIITKYLDRYPCLEVISVRPPRRKHNGF